MQQTGLEGEQVVLLLEDHQFQDSQFLELINSLLSAGEVPGLYTPEELEPLLTPLRDQASESGFRGTLIQYFASRKLLSEINTPSTVKLKPYHAKLIYLNFHTLEVVSATATHNFKCLKITHLFNLRPNICKSECSDSHVQ